MQMMRKRTNCYIYTRVSTSMQVDGYSQDAQREKLRGYAAYQEMTVVGEYSDEGFSGKNIQGRMEFRRMLEDIQTQKDSVDYVLVFKLSRFGRNAADVLNSLQLMQDYAEIQARVKKQTGLNVTPLYIAQVKGKHGIIERENYNHTKSENPRTLKCPPDKEKTIEDALQYFKTI